MLQPNEVIKTTMRRMFYKDNELAKRVFRRIELKQEYLKLFQPNLTYLQFLGDLEVFQSQFESVSIDRKDPKDCVELETINIKLAEICKLYEFTTKTIKNFLENLKTAKASVILNEFYITLDNCKLFLTNIWAKFSQEVEIFCRNIYIIKTLINIDKCLDSLKLQIKVQTLNLENLKHTSLNTEIKRRLESICNSALSVIKDKYEYIKRYFPKSFTATLKRMTTNRDSRPLKEGSSSEDLQKECKDDVDADADDEYELFNLKECLNVEPCMCNAPQVPDDENEAVCSIDSSDSSANRRRIDENTATQEYERSVEKRKSILQQLMADLLKQSRQISRIENEIYVIEAKHELQNECYIKEKQKIDEDEVLNNTEKQQKAKVIDCLIKQRNSKLQRDKQAYEDQKNKIRKESYCQLKQLKHLKKVFCLEHNKMIDYLEQVKVKAMCPSSISEKIEVLQKNYECEVARIEEYEEKISNLYEGNDDISDQTTESEISSSLSKLSSSKESELLKPVDVKNDNEMYIKHVLGKALIQGLAQITIAQPTDPVYYLANYLIHYKHSELNNLRKQIDLGELLMERDKCSKRIKEDKESCNPCKVKPTDPCE